MPSSFYDLLTHNASAPHGVYSPVTLSHEWPKLDRLLFMVCCSVISSIMNGYFVASFFVEHTLKRLGNAFLACVGVADMLITTGVMPMSAVVLLSGEWDLLPVCQSLHFLTEASTYSYSIFFALAAGECYYRVCGTSSEYDMIFSMRIGCLSIIVFCVSIVVAGVGVFMDLDYDYCERKHFGNFYFRIITFVILHVIPMLLTIFGFVTSLTTIRKKSRDQTQYKRSQQFDRDYSAASLNLVAYLLYVLAWIPYLIIVLEFPTTSDSKFYYSAWIGISRSAITSFLYCAANRNYRRAFAHLFNYCCCKSSLSSSFGGRHRRDYYRPSCDVRVHIMHKAVNSHSPQRHRAASACRETQDL